MWRVRWGLRRGVAKLAEVVSETQNVPASGPETGEAVCLTATASLVTPKHCWVMPLPYDTINDTFNQCHWPTLQCEIIIED